MAFYKDVNSTSPTVRPDVVDEVAIAQAVRNLVATRKGEKIFDPEFGINRLAGRWYRALRFAQCGVPEELNHLARCFQRAHQAYCAANGAGIECD